MAEISRSIERFLSVSYGSGSGSGSGDGSGYGDGYGDGSGYDSGSGDGYGDGYGLKTFNKSKVYYIDGLPTVLQNVRGNLAKGYIVRNDLTTEKCYVAKGENLFAHGKTSKMATEALQSKIFENMDVDEKLDKFIELFKPGVKYPAKLYYEWHHKLTGSCEFGRNNFVKSHGIDLDNGTYTVEEFINIVKNDYGGEIIERLAERMCE